MIKKRKFPKIFFGWWIVLTGGFLDLWGWGYYGSGFSALFKPISSELGFSRAATAVVAGLGRFEGGFEAPLAGWITDRFGPRWIILFGILLFSLSLIIMNYVQSLWVFYIVWGLMLGTGMNITQGVPLHTVIANWFVKKRGLAEGIERVISGLAGVLVLPLIAWLISTQGWRMTCVIGGLVMVVVGLPLAWFFLRWLRPEYCGLFPDGVTTEEEVADVSRMIDTGVKYAAEVEEVEFTLRQAMRTPAYWLLIIANTAGLSWISLSPHVIPFLTDIGIDPIRAAGMTAILYLASIPARIVGGILTDRVRKNHLRFLVGASYLFQAAGIVVFLLNQTIAMIYVWFILFGIGYGVQMVLGFLVSARYFGRKALGSIRGFSAMFMMPAGIVAPIYFGWVYDTTGSYISVFVLLGGVLAFAGVIASFILPPKPPAQITDVRQIA
ncbi:MFS transporter [Chloroflexota bacterium]